MHAKISPLRQVKPRAGEFYTVTGIKSLFVSLLTLHRVYGVLFDRKL